MTHERVPDGSSLALPLPPTSAFEYLPPVSIVNNNVCFAKRQEKPAKCDVSPFPHLDDDLSVYGEF